MREDQGTVPMAFPACTWWRGTWQTVTDCLKRRPGLIPGSPGYTHLGTHLQVLLTHTQGQPLCKAHEHQHTGDPCEHRTSLMARGHTLVQPGHHPVTHRTGTHRCRQTDGGQDWISPTLGPHFSFSLGWPRPSPGGMLAQACTSRVTAVRSGSRPREPPSREPLLLPPHGGAWRRGSVWRLEIGSSRGAHTETRAFRVLGHPSDWRGRRGAETMMELPVASNGGWGGERQGSHSYSPIKDTHSRAEQCNFLGSETQLQMPTLGLKRHTISHRRGACREDRHIRRS